MGFLHFYFYLEIKIISIKANEMNSLPSELCIYISDTGGDVGILVSLNRWFHELFKDAANISRNRRLMSSVIDTFLVEMKRSAWKKGTFRAFDFYLCHHVTNSQEIDSVRRWWLKKYPQHNESVFRRNLSYVAGNTYERTERVIREYFEEK